VAEADATVQKTKAQCTKCRGVTAHDVVHQVIRRDQSPDGDIQEADIYSIIECRGCETVTFEQAYWCSEDFGPDGVPLIKVTLYPSRTAGRQRVDGWMAYPRKVQRMYLETLAALSADAPVLATVGMRALVEAICLDQGCITGNLEAKIDALVKQGVLAAKQAEYLNVHRFLGNDAVHEMRSPPSSEILGALDILENLLTTIYVLPTTAAEIASAWEQRRLEKLGGLSSSTSLTAAGLPPAIKDALHIP
jgi:hypothetical protein